MPVWLSPFGDRRFAAVATGVPRSTLFRVVLINVGSPAELPQLTVCMTLEVSKAIICIF